MSANTAALLAAATAATAALHTTKTANKAALADAFTTSAIATHAAISGRVSAAKLAEANKAAGIGYGSPAAVGYHALTGSVLLLPVTVDADGNETGAVSGQKVQTLIKKVGQETAKQIIKKAKTQADAADRLADAVVETVDILKELEKAVVACQNAENQRLLGSPFTPEVEALVDSITRSLANITAGNVPIDIQIVSGDEDALDDEAASDDEGALIFPFSDTVLV